MNPGLYVRLRYIHDDRDFVHNCIRLVTGGMGHVLIEFWLITKERPAQVFYFESIFKNDKRTKKNGVRGPIDIANVNEWLNRKPNRWFIVQPRQGFLPLTQEEAWKAMHHLMCACHTIHYAPTQIMQNAFAGLTGVYVHFGKGTDSKWTCSETVVRTVVPVEAWDYFNLANCRMDDIFPGGPKSREFGSLWHGVEAWLRKEKENENERVSS